MHTTRPVRVPLRIWDIVLSSVLIIGLVIATGVALVIALFMTMVSDGCGAGCNMGQIELGVIVGLTLPIVFALAAIVVTIVFLVKRRMAFWVPLAGVGLVALGLGLGSVIAMTAVPGFLA